VTALLHGAFSDCLVAVSDTVLFLWSWSSHSASHIASPQGTSPLREIQGGRAVATSPADTPPRRSASVPGRRLGDRGTKENFGSPQQPSVGGQAARVPPAVVSTPPPKQELAGREERWAAPRDAASPLLSTPEKKRPEGAAAQDVDVAMSQDAFEVPPKASVPDELPARPEGHQSWGLQPPPRSSLLDFEVQARSRPAGRSRSLVSLKVGAEEEDAGTTHRIRQDTAQRARHIHQRQQLDSVGALLREQASDTSASLVVPLGIFRESSAGGFLCRSREGACCEVEAWLPGGRLVRVLRNPFRRTLTFEGQLQDRAQEAGARRLVVQLPAGYDLSSSPEHIDRRFAEGRCLVVVQRGGRYPEPGASPAPSLGEGAVHGRSPFERVHDPLQAECEL